MTMKAPLSEIEPGLEGTIMGKVRLLMRKLGLGHMTPAEFYNALEHAGLDIHHENGAPNGASQGWRKPPRQPERPNGPLRP